jgi:hypothetical protein
LPTVASAWHWGSISLGPDSGASAKRITLTRSWTTYVSISVRRRSRSILLLTCRNFLATGKTSFHLFSLTGGVALNGMDFARTLASWLRGAAADQLRTLRARKRRCPILEIPLGCYRFDKFEMKPMSMRTIDASFAGSIIQERYGYFSPHRYLLTARGRARALFDPVPQKGYGRTKGPRHPIQGDRGFSFS